MTEYRLDRAHAAVTAGVLVVVAAVVAFVAFVLTSVATGVVAALLLLVALVVLLRPPVVVRLDGEGLRSRGRRVPWSEVEDVAADRGACRLTRTDGSVVALALGPVGRRAPELLREVHDRLNTANGYRRIDPGSAPDAGPPA